MSERLDRIEAILTQAAIQQQIDRETFTRQNQAASDRLDRLEGLVQANALETASLRSDLRTEVESVVGMIGSLSEEVTRVSNQVDRMAEHVDQMSERVDRMSDRIDVLGSYMQQHLEQAERDRNQAAIDRNEFRTTVQTLLEVLTQRFSGNGHSND